MTHPLSPAAADVTPDVEALGPDLAIKFLLRLGGARLCFPARAKRRSAAEDPKDAEPFERLGALLADRQGLRVPGGNRWLIAALSACGMSIYDIARIIPQSDVTVVKWLRYAEERERSGRRYERVDR